MRLPLVVAATAAFLLPYVPVQAGTDNHRYKKGEHVELWVNKVREEDVMMYPTMEQSLSLS